MSSTGMRSRRETSRRDLIPVELIREPLYRFSFAVHIDDVVAQIQLEIFRCLARQAQRNRLELKQQIVAEGAGERQLAVVLITEFARERPQNREHARLLAAFLFRKQ